MTEQDYKTEFWRQWAIDGMPADKQRLADAAWQARQPEIDALQVKIDMLMWEYCPEDMTEEQIKNYESRQQPAEEQSI